MLLCSKNISTSLCGATNLSHPEVIESSGDLKTHFNILNEEKVPGATIPPYCNCCSDCCSGLFSGGRDGSQGQIRGIQQKMKIICTCPSVLSIIWNGLAQMSLYVFECACMEGSTGTWSRFTYRHGVNRCWPLFTLQKLPSTLD